MGILKLELIFWTSTFSMNQPCEWLLNYQFYGQVPIFFSYQICDLDSDGQELCEKSALQPTTWPGCGGGVPTAHHISELKVPPFVPHPKQSTSTSPIMPSRRPAHAITAPRSPQENGPPQALPPTAQSMAATARGGNQQRTRADRQEPVAIAAAPVSAAGGGNAAGERARDGHGRGGRSTAPEGARTGARGAAGIGPERERLGGGSQARAAAQTMKAMLPGAGMALLM